ncbi:hypothetical protein AB0L70_03370 [Kribbella sp. NPDC051952]|uniref:hypothetical protein n=1 Tax=Kribbella sp. NPDC051952 TaxID=3154851 RepID=UPI003443E9A0
MSLTDYAGIAGLFAAAAVAIWMLLSPHTPAPTGRHRAAPALRLPRPHHSDRGARHGS